MFNFFRTEDGFMTRKAAEDMLDKALSKGRICTVTWKKKDNTVTTRTVRLWSRKALTYENAVMPNNCDHVPWLYTCLDLEKAKQFGENKGWVNIDTRAVIQVKQKGLF